MTIIQAYYMLKMYQQVMLEKRIKKRKEGFALVVIQFYSFGMYPKPTNHTKFGKYFNSY
jgi:hypothetical protein